MGGPLALPTLTDGQETYTELAKLLSDRNIERAAQKKEVSLALETVKAREADIHALTQTAVKLAESLSFWRAMCDEVADPKPSTAKSLPLDALLRRIEQDRAHVDSSLRNAWDGAR